MSPIVSATPLGALDAIAMDSETTGLDTRADHIVQLAGVPIAGGVVQREAIFVTLVKPPVPVPPSSTAIHGIDDGMLRGAPDFATAYPRFAAYCGDRLLIGHSIGFDLAMLEREAARTGLGWHRPRTLCVRLLGAIANPQLPDQSIEALCGWLGIEIEGRHTAVGDAIAAADIFLALVPHLGRRGIRTLGEAERACLDLTELLEKEYRAGWTEPVSRPEARSFGHIDPFAYRHRVRELMQRQIIVSARDATLKDAIATMSAGEVGAVLVSHDGAGDGHIADYGIVTERDVTKALALYGADALGKHLSQVETRPVASIAAGAFVYRAISRMERRRVRHLAVRDENDRLCGIISARDVLQLRAAAAIALDDALDQAANTAQMAQAWAMLPGVARALLSEKIEAATIAGIISEELRVATRRAGQLAERRMLEEGKGPPPCPYAVLVLGSGGRGESLLAADQDNAIVFAKGEPGSVEDLWFAQLGTYLSDMLDDTGIPLCKGGVMGRNQAWRGSIGLWRKRINEWVIRSNPDDLLNVDIFFDQRPVHGEERLGAQLFEEAYRVAAARPAFTRILGMRTMGAASPFTMLGGIRTRDGRLDLKAHALFPIVASARALALRHDIRRRSTRGRLEGLLERGIGNAAEIRRLITAHAFVLEIMLVQQSRDIESGLPASNRVDVSTLGRDEIARLKEILHAMERIPDMTQALLSA